MVADFGIHLDNPHNPHAHILLTTRDLTPDGFGLKNRGWNDKREQFQEAYLKVTTSPELVRLGVDEAGRERYTTRDMLAPRSASPTVRPLRD
jgi:hypothetical protein